jgi:hypothetical protein
MSFRMIAAGAAMLAALTLATTSTRARAAAESAEAAPASTVHARAAKPQHRAQRRAAKTQTDLAKAHHGKRARLALARHRHRPSEEPSGETVRQSAAPVRPEAAAVSHQQTSAERRFREFLNPQSFAVAVSEELRSPRLLAAHFSGEMADPEIIAASWTVPVAADPPEDAAPIARDQTTGDDSPSTAAALTHSDATTIQRVAQTGNEPTRMSFLRWFFVAWGGVLTFASAVRMAVG